MENGNKIHSIEKCKNIKINTFISTLSASCRVCATVKRDSMPWHKARVAVSRALIISFSFPVFAFEANQILRFYELRVDRVKNFPTTLSHAPNPTAAQRVHCDHRFCEREKVNTTFIFSYMMMKIVSKLVRSIK